MGYRVYFYIFWLVPKMDSQTLEQQRLNTLLSEKLDALKQTEAALRESQERYTLAMQASRDGLWDWNVLTNEVYYAPRFKAILGYQDHEMENQFSAFESRLHPDDHDRVLTAVRDHLERQAPYDVEYRLQNKQGNYLWIHAQGQAIWHKTGKPTRMAGSISDITERKQTEAQIYEITQRLALATNSANIGVWDFDLVEDRLIWDDRMYELYGIEAATFGGAYEAWKRGVHPDDIQAADAEIQAAIKGEKDFHTEFRVVWPDGQVRFIEAHAITLRDGADKARRMIGVNWDITDRKQTEVALRESEARWQFALEGAGDGVWDWNLQTNEVFYSHQWKAMLGHENHEVGNSLDEWDSRVHPQDKAQCYADMNRHLIGKSPLYQNEHRVRHKDGNYKWVLDRGKVVEWDQVGKAQRMIGIHTDITDRKQAEDALRQLNEGLETKVQERTQELEQRAQELERSNAELEQFAYVASHDLQEPLRTISSYTELLAEEYRHRLDGEADEYIDFIVDGATRMQQLIKDLLAFSRVGTRGKAFALTSCNAVMQKVLVNLKLAIEECQALVTHDPLPEVIADASQIHQLFQNLVSNALKFRSQEPPRIHISATLHQEEWEFCIRDNGIGIEPDYFEQIFVIFQRLHSRRHYEGTGIGLAICRKILQRHDGRIWVDSSPGQGASFYFTLPSHLGSDNG
ncbi:MAG: PAS domain-containing protein [Cyanobacteria bacterium J06639_16]